MGLFFRVSDSEMVKIKNQIFIEKGHPALLKSGFEKAPFSSCWNGRDNHHGFSYTYCRLKGHFLEVIEVHIIKGDKSIQLYLNIFQPYPQVIHLVDLKNSNFLNYILPPNSLSRMRLRSDDYKWIPVITPSFFSKHKIGRYNSRWRLNRRIKSLRNLIEKDMLNIDSFVGKWHELHTPKKVDWEGNILDSDIYNYK